MRPSNASLGTPCSSSCLASSSSCAEASLPLPQHPAQEAWIQHPAQQLIDSCSASSEDPGFETFLIGIARLRKVISSALLDVDVYLLRRERTDRLGGRSMTLQLECHGGEGGSSLGPASAPDWPSVPPLSSIRCSQHLPVCLLSNAYRSLCQVPRGKCTFLVRLRYPKR